MNVEWNDECLNKQFNMSNVKLIMNLSAALNYTLTGSRTNDGKEFITNSSESITDYNVLWNVKNITKSSTDSNEIGCVMQLDEWKTSYFESKLAVSDLEAIFTVIILSIIIVVTIIGNILVILSVFTYKPLRIVQNFFIVSLAVADLAVALLVLPFNVAYSILGRWEFGIFLCKMWLTCDIMCCTSSILNLCAIALDRYWAITDPINYAQKRTVGRVLVLIAGVWILSLLISSPPLLGWNDWPKEFTSVTPCELNSDPGYVIYSALGSFFIPLIIMTTVYIEIYIATRRRLRERALATKFNTIATRSARAELVTKVSFNDSAPETFLPVCTSFLCCCQKFSRVIQNDQESERSDKNFNNDGLFVSDLRIQGHSIRRKARITKVKDSIKPSKTNATKNKTKNTGNSVQTKTSSKLLHNKKSCAENREISTESSSGQKGCGKLYGNRGGIDISRDDKCSLKLNTTQLSVETHYKTPNEAYQFIQEKQKISLSKERRAARTLGIIMGVFVICWLPFFIMYVTLPFCAACCPTVKVKNFITWLGYINSVFNPIIYTIFNLEYRKAFKKLLGIN